MPSGWFTANPPFGVSGETPLCFKRWVFPFLLWSISESADCSYFSFFLYLQQLWIHGPLGHLQRGLAWLFFIARKVKRPFMLSFILIRGTLTHVGACFHPSPLTVVFTWLSLCVSIKNSLWSSHCFEFYTSIKRWNETLTPIGWNAIVFFCHFVRSRWHCSFYDALKAWGRTWFEHLVQS